MNTFRIKYHSNRFIAFLGAVPFMLLTLALNYTGQSQNTPAAGMFWMLVIMFAVCTPIMLIVNVKTLQSLFFRKHHLLVIDDQGIVRPRAYSNFYSFNFHGTARIDFTEIEKVRFCRAQQTFGELRTIRLRFKDQSKYKRYWINSTHFYSDDDYKSVMELLKNKVPHEDVLFKKK